MRFKKKVSQLSMSAMSSMTDDEVWQQWNIADHKRAVEERNKPFADHNYGSEETLVSTITQMIRQQMAKQQAEAANQPAETEDAPPAGIMHYSMSSRQWEHVEQACMHARIGEIFFVKDGKGGWDTSPICISFALLRVDTPYRWKRYCVHHVPSERFQDVITQHME